MRKLFAVVLACTMLLMGGSAALAESGVFQTLLILRQDKSFRAERAAL